MLPPVRLSAAWCQVESSTDTTVTLTAGNDATLDGLLTIKICHRWGGCGCVGGLPHAWQHPQMPMLPCSRLARQLLAHSSVFLLRVCSDLEDFSDCLGQPILSDVDVEMLKFLGCAAAAAEPLLSPMLLGRDASLPPPRLRTAVGGCGPAVPHDNHVALLTPRPSACAAQQVQVRH